jgi:hypothetical protein
LENGYFHYSRGDRIGAQAAAKNLRHPASNDRFLDEALDVRVSCLRNSGAAANSIW